MSQRSKVRLAIRSENGITSAAVLLADGPVVVATARDSFLQAPGNQEAFQEFLRGSIERMLAEMFPEAQVSSTLLAPGQEHSH